MTRHSPENRRVLDRLGALLPITDVLGSCELGVVKADPRFWSLAAERVGVGTLIDDDLGNVEAARRAGWDAIHFTGAHTLDAL